MAITPKCDKCGDELANFGDILLGPPDAQQKVAKYHLCVVCYGKIASTLTKNKKA